MATSELKVGTLSVKPGSKASAIQEIHIGEHRISLPIFAVNGREPGVTLAVMLVVALVNALLNQIFIFELGLGVAGSGWATGAARW